MRRGAPAVPGGQPAGACGSGRRAGAAPRRARAQAVSGSTAGGRRLGVGAGSALGGRRPPPPSASPWPSLGGLLRLFGLLVADQALTLGLATDAVGLRLLDARRVRLDADAEAHAEVEGLLVGETELFRELVDTDLCLPTCVSQAFRCSCSPVRTALARARGSLVSRSRASPGTKSVSGGALVSAIRTSSRRRPRPMLDRWGPERSGERRPPPGCRSSTPGIPAQSHAPRPGSVRPIAAIRRPSRTSRTSSVLRADGGGSRCRCAGARCARQASRRLSRRRSAGASAWPRRATASRIAAGSAAASARAAATSSASTASSSAPRRRRPPRSRPRRSPRPRPPRRRPRRSPRRPPSATRLRAVVGLGVALRPRPRRRWRRRRRRGCQTCSPVAGSTTHSPCAHSSVWYDSSSASWVSLLMSTRQPVRRAARRAFWPSLPMASDSW